MTQEEALGPLAALEALKTFARRCGEASLRLLLHAAVPQSLRPELLTLIRLNFVPEANDAPAAEADVLLAPFCQELGGGYYRFDPEVRRQAIQHLYDAYPDEEPGTRPDRVGALLLAYVADRKARGLVAPDSAQADWLNIQGWTGAAFRFPGQAAAALARALKEPATSLTGISAQLGAVTSAVSIPLAGHPELLRYAKGINAIAAGDSAMVLRLFEDMPDEAITVENVELPSPKDVLQRVTGIETKNNTVTMAPTNYNETAERKIFRVFISYSRKDKQFIDALLLHLRAVRNFMLEPFVWDDTQIASGSNWRDEIQSAMDSAHIILLMISPDFMASDFIIDQEVALAQERYRHGDCIVAPIILRPTPLWEKSVIGRLQALPRNAKPINLWPDRDKAWQDVVANLVEMVETRGLLSEVAPNQTQNAAFYVPFPPNLHFFGREYELMWLQRTFNNVEKQPVVLLSRMGGVGKTAIAAEYAHRHRNDYQVVWWVDAGTAASCDLAFADLAAKLRLPGHDSPRLTDVRATVMAWLDQTSDWLLVFDNAESPNDLAGWLPPRPRGHLLITSRNPAWERVARTLGIDVWDIATTAAFLLKHSGSKDKAAARQLAERLGGLPLACEQAGAYVAANGISLSAYIERFDSDHARLLEQGAPDVSPSLTVTVRLGLESVKRSSPLAVTILRGLSCFATADIPRLMLDKWKGAKSLVVTKAVVLLLRQSLIRVADDNLSLHPMVQRLVRDFDPDHLLSLGNALHLLSANLTGDPQTDVQDWPLYASLLPHGEALFATLPDPPPEPKAAGHIANLFGMFLIHAQGDYAGARAWLDRAVKITESYSSDDLEIGVSLNNLGQVRLMTGDLEAAKAAFQQAIHITEAHYGPDHPDVAQQINNLGRVLFAMGDIVSAKDYHERALRITEQTFGPDHPEVANQLNNLGYDLAHMKDYVAAKARFERALRITEINFGPDHPQTANVISNLGSLFANTGDLSSARDQFRRALAIREKHLPPEHPDVQRSRQNLANLEAELSRRR